MRGGKGQEDIPRAIRAPATDARKPNRRPLRQPLQLDRMQWRRRSDHDDDTAVFLAAVFFRLVPACCVGFPSHGLDFCAVLVDEDLANGDAADAQVALLTVIALHERTHRVGDRLHGLGLFVEFQPRDQTRRTARAALEAVAEHPRPAAGVPFTHGIARRTVDAAHDMRWRDGQGADIAHDPIERLGDHGQEEPVAEAAAVAVLADTVLVNPRVGRSDGEGVGDDDRGVEQTGFVQPVHARHLARAVEPEIRGVASLVEEVFSGEDGGDAGADFFGIC